MAAWCLVVTLMLIYKEQPPEKPAAVAKKQDETEGEVAFVAYADNHCAVQYHYRFSS